MKILTILSICLMWMGCLSAQQNLSALVPMPNYIETQEGKAFVVTEKTQIVITDASLQFEAEELQRVFKAQMGLKLNIQTGGVKGKHIYLKAEGQNESLEHYQLQVQPKRIEISAESSKGVFYGIQTLAQLLLGDAENTAHNRIAPVVLEDSPRFAFRGFMLDVARHFLPVSDVKRFIDLMVRYKYNVLQLHLTDDQGWRIEIKKYPQLTKVGAFRDEKGGDQGPDNGFYTQEQLKDIIDYAAERHVEIIPELDIPGHTAAVLAVFPEMLCQRPDTVEVKIGKVCFDVVTTDTASQRAVALQFVVLFAVVITATNRYNLQKSIFHSDTAAPIGIGQHLASHIQSSLQTVFVCKYVVDHTADGNLGSLVVFTVAVIDLGAEIGCLQTDSPLRLFPIFKIASIIKSQIECNGIGSIVFVKTAHIRTDKAGSCSYRQIICQFAGITNVHTPVFRCKGAGIIAVLVPYIGFRVVEPTESGGNSLLLVQITITGNPM